METTEELPPAERRERAIETYREAAKQGRPPSARELGEQFGMSRSWARPIIQAATNGHHEGDQVAANGDQVAASGQPPGGQAVAWWQRMATTLSVLVVAGVAGFISYSHIRDLAASVGEGSAEAALLPLSVDGMMVAASMTALVRRRQGLAVGGATWFALGLGVAASVAANVAAAEPGMVARVVAAWSPVALFVTLERVFHQAGSNQTPTTGEAVVDDRTK